MLKEITKKEFEERFPDVSTYGLEHDMPVYLENGVILTVYDWNGESYTVKDENGMERTYTPIEEPNNIDEDDEVLDWNIIGYEEY